ncbi:MAG: hypothetical protein NVSMB39_3060 [Candidatus Saccharimonadales bacterium]
MGMNQTEVSENTETAEGQMSEVEQRLAAIAAAMNNAQASVDTAVAKRQLPDGMACPIDPAERALCEGCQ